MRKWLMVPLAALLLLAGCSGGSGSDNPLVEWTKDAGTVVFQIDQGVGFVMPFDAQTDMPELTVFGDGTVVTVRNDDDGTRRVMSAKLSEQELGRLLALADKEMAGLKQTYDNMFVTDMGTTHFGLVTAAGTRKVSAYALSLDPPPGVNPDQKAYDQLRGIQKAFYDALPKEMAPYVPSAVTLMTQALPPEGAVGELLEWPKELPALPVAPVDSVEAGKAELTGDSAKAVAAAVPYRSNRIYKQGDGYYMVAVRPVLPTLFQ